MLCFVRYIRIVFGWKCQKVPFSKFFFPIFKLPSSKRAAWFPPLDSISTYFFWKGLIRKFIQFRPFFRNAFDRNFQNVISFDFSQFHGFLWVSLSKLFDVCSDQHTLVFFFQFIFCDAAHSITLHVSDDIETWLHKSVQNIQLVQRSWLTCEQLIDQSSPRLGIWNSQLGLQIFAQWIYRDSEPNTYVVLTTVAWFRKIKLISRKSWLNVNN